MGMMYCTNNIGIDGKTFISATKKCIFGCNIDNTRRVCYVYFYIMELTQAKYRIRQKFRLIYIVLKQWDMAKQYVKHNYNHFSQLYIFRGLL